MIWLGQNERKDNVKFINYYVLLNDFFICESNRLFPYDAILKKRSSKATTFSFLCWRCVRNGAEKINDTPGYRGIFFFSH